MKSHRAFRTVPTPMNISPNLKKRAQRTEKAYSAKAMELHELRLKAAAYLKKVVLKELAELAIDNGDLNWNSCTTMIRTELLSTVAACVQPKLGWNADGSCFQPIRASRFARWSRLPRRRNLARASGSQGGGQKKCQDASLAAGVR